MVLAIYDGTSEWSQEALVTLDHQLSASFLWLCCHTTSFDVFGLVASAYVLPQLLGSFDHVASLGKWQHLLLLVLRWYPLLT